MAINFSLSPRNFEVTMTNFRGDNEIVFGWDRGQLTNSARNFGGGAENLASIVLSYAGEGWEG